MKVDLEKIRGRHIFLFQLGFFVIINILWSLIDWLNNNYYILYPSKTKAIAWSLFLFFATLFVFSGFVLLRKYFKKDPSKIIKYTTTFSFSGLLSLSLIQYVVYLNSPNSYKVDESLIKYHVNKEISKLDSLIVENERELAIFKEIFQKTPDAKIKATADKFIIDGIDLWFCIYDSYRPITPLPTLSIASAPTLKRDEANVLGIAYMGHKLSICRKEETEVYFDSLNSSKSLINTIFIKKIINNHISELLVINNKLAINKKYIITRGLPISVFLTSSLDIGLIFNDYQPLSITSRLLKLVQLFFIILFILPFFGELYIRYKQGFSKKNNSYERNAPHQE